MRARSGGGRSGGRAGRPLRGVGGPRAARSPGVVGADPGSGWRAPLRTNRLRVFAATRLVGVPDPDSGQFPSRTPGRRVGREQASRRRPRERPGSVPEPPLSVKCRRPTRRDPLPSCHLASGTPGGSKRRKLVTGAEARTRRYLGPSERRGPNRDVRPKSRASRQAERRAVGCEIDAGG